MILIYIGKNVVNLKHEAMELAVEGKILNMARLAGVEPATSSSGGTRSIQMSYRRNRQA